MIKLKFAHERETKNMQRFNEIVPQGQNAKVGPLYVSKEAVGNATELTVTIEPAS
jgi:hypothetical protein